MLDGVWLPLEYILSFTSLFIFVVLAGVSEMGESTLANSGELGTFLRLVPEEEISLSVGKQSLLSLVLSSCDTVTL